MANGEAHPYVGKDLEAMSFARNYHHWILSLIRPYLNGSVCEVGAGVGSFSQLLLDCDIERLTAFEPSARMHAQLAEAIAGDPRAVAVNDFLTRDSAAEGFDTVVYVNVLEHIERDAEELCVARDTLRPGGNLVIFVPALPMLYSPLDKEIGHFRRYTRPGLERLVDEASLRRVTSRYLDVAGILPWYVNFVLLKRSIGGGTVSAYDRLVVPIMRRVEALLPMPLGKNVLLIANKR